MDKSKQAITVYEKIAQDYASKFTKVTDRFAEFNQLLPLKARVLDLGCGPGVEVAWLIAKGHSVIGLDYTKKMVQIAKKTAKKATILFGDMRRANFPKGKFDAILLSYSLIHIPKKDVPLLIQKIYTWLRSQGLLYVGIQAGRSAEVFVREPFKPDEKIFLNILSQRELIHNLKQVGFSIVHEYKRKAKNKEELGYTKFVVFARK